MNGRTAKLIRRHTAAVGRNARAAFSARYRAAKRRWTETARPARAALRRTLRVGLARAGGRFPWAAAFGELRARKAMR